MIAKQVRLRLLAASLCVPALAGGVFLAGARANSGGVQDPAWSPDGRFLATSFFDRIWVSAPDGKNGRRLTNGDALTERDPAWSRDGQSIAFALETEGSFDIHVVSSRGGTPKRLTSLDGDERWPSWTTDGRVVFSHRPHLAAQWRLFVVKADGGAAAPLFSDSGNDDQREARVSPDGRRIAFVSDRESEDGDVDLWVAELAADARGRIRRSRVTRVRGREGFPSWAPDNARIAFYALREGAGSIWVADADAATMAGGGRGAPPAPSRPRPASPPMLVSRHGGIPAWSPDGKRIVVSDLPPPDPTYNGNPLRSADDPPPLFAADAFRLWTVDAPLPIDSGARAIAMAGAKPAQLAGAFDRVWETLRRLYYSTGETADRWARLKEKYAPEARAAKSEAAIEEVVDRLVAEQPLIKPAVISPRAVVVTGHRLASEAGAMALSQGGNIVDAAIAASFALGVVEPEASGIGGDGMALLYLKGMTEPAVVDYKDQVPIRATSDNQALRQSTGDGPAAANIPGVVAGLDYLYRTYGSKKVAWADLVAPAIRYAEEGFVLDAALPTSIAEGRRYFEKHAEAKKIYLPGGTVPKPGDTFVNTDYAATLRAIAKDPQAFYRGDIARRIAADMAAHGGLITLDDLAQYRAIERKPLSGRYRDHVVYSTPPPVSTGLALIETLQILQNYSPRPGASYATDADYFHHALEAWKVRDSSGRIADPALFDVSLGPHLDPAHAAGLFKRIDPNKASRYAVPGPGRGNAPSSPGDAPVERISTGTTAFAVADAEGNMIALTQTLSTWGGTFYVSEGLGFLYNNHLRFGGGGAPGRFLPLARSSSTSVPTLVFKAGASGPGTPKLAVAAAGNAWIPASVYDIILNVVDAGMPAQQAIEAPRFLIGRDPNESDVARMQIEDRFPRALLQDLIARGHRFHKIGRKGEVRYGYAAAVVVDMEKREVQGGAEPRRSHAAAAPR
jgi:gamma-glutamyltranspeptidase